MQAETSRFNRRQLLRAGVRSEALPCSALRDLIHKAKNGSITCCVEVVEGVVVNLMHELIVISKASVYI